MARVAAIRAGCPVTVAGTTVNRFCSSGLQATSIAAQRVVVDGAPVMVAGRRRIDLQGAEQPEHERPHQCVDARAQARDLHADGADGGGRGEALQGLARIAGRVRAAVAAADGRRAEGRQDRRGDRADRRDDGGARQADRRDIAEGAALRHGRGEPPGHDARGPRQAAARVRPAGNGDGRQLLAALRRRRRSRADERRRSREART